jgi:hypothetical protein
MAFFICTLNPCKKQSISSQNYTFFEHLARYKHIYYLIIFNLSGLKQFDN